jgi:hypothetical protein
VAVAMAAGGADRVGRRNDARAGHDALLDALLDGDVVEVGGTHVAHGGKAGLEGFLRVGDADHRPEIVREFQSAIAAVARVGGQMRMHVDQSRQQRHPFKIDVARARGTPWPLRRPRDASIGDGDQRVIDHAAGQHI